MQEAQTLELIEPDAPEQQSHQPGALVMHSDSPMDRMMQAIDRGLDLEKVARMMELQERWEKREAEKAFRADFAAFTGENIIIPKSKFVDRGRAGSFNQAEYDEVKRRLAPALARHGFGFRHDEKFGWRRVMQEGVENDIPWVYVTCFLEHRQGHAEKLELEGPPGELSANTPVQNMQATASYLKRQSLLAITGTATGGEDDESQLHKGDQGAGQETQDDQLQAVLQEGRDASVQGMARLTAWWGKLDAKTRSRLNDDFGRLRKVAREADERGGDHGQE